MTSLLDRMERDDLVRRERDPEDRRKLRIVLTERGKAVSEKALDPHLDWVNQTMSDLSKTDLGALKLILLKSWRDLIRQADEVDLSLIKDLKTASGG